MVRGRRQREGVGDEREMGKRNESRARGKLWIVNGGLEEEVRKDEETELMKETKGKNRG